MPTRPATCKYIPVGVVGHLPGCYESGWRPVNEDKCFRIEDRLLIFNNTVDWYKCTKCTVSQKIGLTWTELSMVLRANMVAQSLTVDSLSKAPCVSINRTATCEIMKSRYWKYWNTHGIFTV